MEDKIDYTPTYVEYVEMLNVVIEERLEKFHLDYEMREKLFRSGLLKAHALYCDGFEEGTEIELGRDHWKKFFVETGSFSVEIGVRYKENWREISDELLQIRDMVCEGMCIIYKRMRDDVENKDSRTWAGQLKLLGVSLGATIGDGKALDFRHVFATLLCRLIRKDDIVMRTLTGEAMDGVEIEEWL